MEDQQPGAPGEQEAPTIDGGASSPSTTDDELVDATSGVADVITDDPNMQGMPTAGGNAAVAMDVPLASSPTTSEEGPTETATETAPETPAETPLDAPLPSAEGGSNSGSDTGSGASETGTMEAMAGSGGPSSTRTTAAVAGGVVGGVALLSLGIFLIWFLRRRRERRRRSTMLTSMFGDPGFGRGEKGVGSSGGGGSGGSGGYQINRTSLGPTPVSEKVKDSIVSTYQRMRGRLPMIAGSRSPSPGPTVDLDRGTSQFGPPPPAVTAMATAGSRADSRFSDYDGYKPTAKERLVGWWGRVGRSGPPKSSRTDNDPFAMGGGGGKTRGAASNANANVQPDFNTLLRMDEDAARRGLASGRRQSTTAHFLGGLAFDFDGPSAGSGTGNAKANANANPFSDDNATRRDSSDSTRHESATIPPLAYGERSAARDQAARDPFSDANAIGASNGIGIGIGIAGGKGSGPATYVQDLRRSRGRSVSADHSNNLNLNSNNNSGSGGNYNYPFRGSVSSIGSSRRASSVGNAAAAGASSGAGNSGAGNNGAAHYSSLFVKRSTKFRSDPFDLDRPELLSSSSRDGSRDISSGSGAATGSGETIGTGVCGGGINGNYATVEKAPPVPAPMTAHLRGPSYASWTSRYSGVSEEGAGDGFDDLWSDPGPDVGPAAAKTSGSGSGPGKRNSQTSVGKAL